MEWFVAIVGVCRVVSPIVGWVWADLLLHAVRLLWCGLSSSWRFSGFFVSVWVLWYSLLLVVICRLGFGRFARGGSAGWWSAWFVVGFWVGLVVALL